MHIAANFEPLGRNYCAHFDQNLILTRLRLRSSLWLQNWLSQASLTNFQMLRVTTRFGPIYRANRGYPACNQFSQKSVLWEKRNIFQRGSFFEHAVKFLGHSDHFCGQESIFSLRCVTQPNQCIGEWHFLSYFFRSDFRENRSSYQNNELYVFSRELREL